MWERLASFSSIDKAKYNSLSWFLPALQLSLKGLISDWLPKLSPSHTTYTQVCFGSNFELSASGLQFCMFLAFYWSSVVRSYTSSSLSSTITIQTNSNYQWMNISKNVADVGFAVMLSPQFEVKAWKHLARHSPHNLSNFICTLHLVYPYRSQLQLHYQPFLLVHIWDCPGLAGIADFIYSSSFGAMSWIYDENSADITLAFYLLQSSACIAARSLLRTLPWQSEGWGCTRSWAGTQPGKLALRNKGMSCTMQHRAQ